MLSRIRLKDSQPLRNLHEFVRREQNQVPDEISREFEQKVDELNRKLQQREKEIEELKKDMLSRPAEPAVQPVEAVVSRPPSEISLEGGEPVYQPIQERLLLEDGKIGDAYAG